MDAMFRSKMCGIKHTCNTSSKSQHTKISFKHCKKLLKSRKFSKIMIECKIKEEIMLPTRTEVMSGYPFNRVHVVLEAIADIEQNQQLNEEIIEKVMDIEPSGINFLFGKLERRGFSSRAYEVFRIIQNRGYSLNTILYSKLMAIYSGDEENFQIALSLFQEMLDVNIQPDQVSFNTVINAAVTSKHQQLVQQYLDQMINQYNFKPDVITYNMQIVESQDIPEALRLFEQMLLEGIRPSKYTYITLMSLYRKYGNPYNPEEEQDIFNLMENAGIKPDAPSLNQLIGVCARKRAWDQAWIVFKNMAQMQIQPTIITYNCILAACQKCNQPDKALKVFKLLQQDKERLINTGPDLYTYNILLSVFAKSGRRRQVFQIYNQMQDEEIEPDATTLSTLISGYPPQQWQEAYRLFQTFISEKNVVPNRIVFNSLFTLLGKAGKYQRVISLYKQMLLSDIEPDVYTFAALIKGCERAEQHDLAICFFDEMLDRDVVPNIYVFGAALSACERGNKWEKAVQVFNIMQEQGVEMDKITMYARKFIYTWPPFMASLPPGLVKAARVTINSGRAVRKWIDHQIY
eukprot:TRINITY_DN1404_c0_g1_i1.p1 TRINITY_DN1404_c0_g1~~TRINITY_DN1404_c0_g1_i1.p1  ORF type:complete len:574 (+),score=29.15 TRINITY_DN1404_c0_g1_i1:65-1786(+)